MLAAPWIWCLLPGMVFGNEFSSYTANEELVLPYERLVARLLFFPLFSVAQLERKTFKVLSIKQQREVIKFPGARRFSDKRNQRNLSLAVISLRGIKHDVSHTSAHIVSQR